MLFVYRPGSSFFHHMDAVSKLVWLLAMTAILLVTSDLTENLVILAWLVLLALILAGIPLGILVRRVLPLMVVGIWLLVVMSVLYTLGTTVIFTIGPFRVTREGFLYGAALFVRLVSLGVTSIIFGITTDPRRMVKELIEYGRLPYRMAYAIYAALRFLPLLQTEAQNVLNAHAVRGAVEKPRTLLSQITPVRRLTIPLLVSALRRIQITAIAMDSRGFGAHARRTNIDDLRRDPLGVAFAVATVAVFIAFFVWRVVLGHGTLLRAPILSP